MSNLNGDNIENENVFNVSEKDLEIINEKLLKKFKDNNVKLSRDNIYSELELVKKDPTNSFIYHIVNEYLINNGYNIDNNNIIDISIKLFDTEYKYLIEKYKKDKKEEYNIKNKKIGKKTLLPFEGDIIEVPNRIGHSYVPIKILPMTDLEDKYSRHKRLKVFHNKGLKCVNCDRVGKYLIAARDKGGSIHIDVYTEDFKLMTVDHIKPKSKGGTYDLENLDPMCARCNTKKADKYDE